MKRWRFFAGVLLSAGKCLSLHPLLCTVGTAAAGLGVYYYLSKLGDKQQSEEADNPSIAEEVPQDQATGHAQSTAPPPDHCSAAQHFWDRVWQAHTTNRCEPEWIMEQIEVYEELLKELERDQDCCDSVMVKYSNERDALSHNLKPFQISMSSIERKQKKSLKGIAQLTHEMTNLTSLVDTLQDTVQDMKNLISETRVIRDEECEHEEMKENLELCEQLPLTLLFEAEEKRQQALVTISLLESERTNLKHQLETLQDTVNNLMQLNYETQKKSDDQCEQERQAKRIFQTEQDFMTLRLQHCEDLLRKHGISY